MTCGSDKHGDPRYLFLASPWSHRFAEIVSRATRELFVVSPFVNLGGVRILARHVKRASELSLTLLTNITPRGAADRTTDPDALAYLYAHFRQVQISSLGALHAKVYAIDRHTTIISSANLTTGGLRTNFEYGVLIEDPTLTARILEDMHRYYVLGNILDRGIVYAIRRRARELRALLALRDKALAGRVRRATERMKVELLKNRTKGGRTVGAILSETIVRLLEQHGSLTTAELHGLIQPLHPDICDDAIDLVIDGERFGRKWKHQVRNAQQSLKRAGRVAYHDSRWHLVA